MADVYDCQKVSFKANWPSPEGDWYWSHLVHSVIEKKQEPTKKSSFDNNERRDV